MSDGARIVLTADRTLMTDYDILFDAMVACTQTTSTPAAIMNSLLLPRLQHTRGQADFAPIGIRRIEAELRSAGVPEDDIVICDGVHLDRAIGPDTEIIGVSSGEPLGRGMSSTTMTAIAGGDIYPAVMFRRLMDRINKLREGCPHANVIVGGPGAWQLVADESARRAFGIDHVFQGHSGERIADIFNDIAAGEDVPEIVEAEDVCPEDIGALVGPTVMGACEISRGCGYGCDFCTMADQRMVHLPVGAIVADVEVNVEAGMHSITLLSEDFLRYGSDGTCKPEAVLELVRRLRRIDRIHLIQTDHANVSSIAAFSDSELALLRGLLIGEGDWVSWLNIGVETAAGELLAAAGGGPKMRGVDPSEWGEFAAEQIRRLCQAGFIPLVSIMVGLPGETEEHIEATHRWVGSLEDLPVCIFPVLYAPIAGSAQPDPDALSVATWELIARCYELNFQWVPRLYFEQQAAADVSLAKRGILQLLGSGQAFLWRRHIARRVRSAEG